ncbi:hypothetical protein Hanom_Chr05g00438811 [Helianthus anomalus]
MSFVLNVSKFYTLCPLRKTQLEFSVKLCHVTRVEQSFPLPTCVFPSFKTLITPPVHLQLQFIFNPNSTQQHHLRHFQQVT